MCPHCRCSFQASFLVGGGGLWSALATDGFQWRKIPLDKEVGDRLRDIAALLLNMKLCVLHGNFVLIQPNCKLRKNQSTYFKNAGQLTHCQIPGRTAVFHSFVLPFQFRGQVPEIMLHCTNYCSDIKGSLVELLVSLNHIVQNWNKPGHKSLKTGGMLLLTVTHVLLLDCDVEPGFPILPCEHPVFFFFFFSCCVRTWLCLTYLVRWFGWSYLGWPNEVSNGKLVSNTFFHPSSPLV